MKATLVLVLSVVSASILSITNFAAEAPFLPMVVLIVDESGLPLRDVPVRLEDPSGAEQVQPPDQTEKLWMERIAQPVRSDERGAAVLFYRGRIRRTITNDGPVYSRPISGTVVVDSPDFERSAHSLTDVFGRTGLQPPNWAPFLKIVLKRREARK